MGQVNLVLKTGRRMRFNLSDEKTSQILDLCMKFEMEDGRK